MPPERRWPLEPEPSRDIRLDARSLRGLAHPLRIRLLGLLREEGPSTATRLAERLGLTSGATSYHLRRLAAYGFVVEDGERGRGRERWWRSAHRSTWLDRRELDAESAALGDAYLRAVAMLYADRVQQSIDEASALPIEWRAAGTLSDYSLQLRPDELERMLEEIVDVVARYPAAEARYAPPSNSAPVVLQIAAFRRPGALTNRGT